MALESRLMKQMKEMLANALERNTLSFDRWRQSDCQRTSENSRVISIGIPICFKESYVNSIGKSMVDSYSSFERPNTSQPSEDHNHFFDTGDHCIAERFPLPFDEPNSNPNEN